MPRARVVVVDDERATEAFKPQPAIVRQLASRAILNFTGKTSLAEAWRAIASTQDVVGIKVFSSPGPHVGTRPAVVAAVVEGLLAAGVPTNHVIVWDRHLMDLRRAGFIELAERYGIRAAGAVESGWDEAVFYESALLGQPVFGDLEFQKKGETIGRKSFVTKLLTREVTRIVNVSPLLNHNSAGVCGNLYSLALGSVDNVLRFEGDAAKLAEAVPEIYGLPALADRVALNVVDALVCQYEGEQIGRLHSSAALNQLRLSRDPVALDVLSIRELVEQRERTGHTSAAATNSMALYRNAMFIELGTADVRKIDLESSSASR